jgi:hypothetical protein
VVFFDGLAVLIKRELPTGAPAPLKVFPSKSIDAERIANEAGDPLKRLLICRSRPVEILTYLFTCESIP